MRNLLLILLTFFAIHISELHSAESPYPIILVHGLNSDDQTWSTLLGQISLAWDKHENSVLHFVLNARGGDTTLLNEDVLIPAFDISGNPLNTIGNSSIYLINFGNFWNRNVNFPGIILYSNSTPGSSQSPSNQSAIFKQAFALSIAIDSVLNKTGAEKVILVGHSMGGLAIREYLQRRENGMPKWWVNTADTIAGHRVAKVVTTGTPHLGTNVTSIPLFTIDNSSEAMRDMRISYTNGQNGAFLFTNSESNITTNFYNRDIDCNNNITDNITGISSGNNFNPLLPLPLNVHYTYVTSNYLGLGTDLAVSTSRQWLYSGGKVSPDGMSDTLYNTRNHLQQTSDNRSIIRGLDEPDRKELSYSLKFGRRYSGYITTQSGGSVSDTDFYDFSVSSSGLLKTFINSSNAGVNEFAVLDESGQPIFVKNYSGTTDSQSVSLGTGKYFLRITGNSSQNANLNFHTYKVEFTPVIRLHLTALIEGFWNGVASYEDTLRISLRQSFSPFTAIDSGRALMDSNGGGMIEFPDALAGSYYISVHHRNGLETWSSEPLEFQNAVPSEFDFTAAAASAFGSNLILKSSKWCFFSGDTDRDGAIDATDLAMIDNDASQFATGYIVTDLDGNSFTDGSDYLIADNNATNFVGSIRP